jgi:PAB1-binding protein PBP1
LVLNPNSAVYYLDLGSVLSAFAPNKPEYCPETVQLLTQIEKNYPDNTILTRNADVGLQICAEVTAGLTATPATTLTPGATQVDTPTPTAPYLPPAPLYTQLP